MPLEESMGLGNEASRAMAALLLMGAATNAYDAFSAVNSSPWTSETFGGDPEKEASLREYVLHAIVISTAFTIAGSVIARTWWPVIGGAAASAYMYWLYMRAIARAKQRATQSQAEGARAHEEWGSG